MTQNIAKGYYVFYKLCGTVRSTTFLLLRAGEKYFFLNPTENFPLGDNCSLPLQNNQL